MAENVVEARNLHPLSSLAVTLHAMRKSQKREMKILILLLSDDLLLFLMLGYLISSQLSFSSFMILQVKKGIFGVFHWTKSLHYQGCRCQDGMAKKGWWCCTTNLPCIPVAIKKWTTKTPPYKFFWKNRKCPKVFNNDFKTEEGSPWIPTDTWVALRMASFSKAKEHHFLSLHTCTWATETHSLCKMEHWAAV